MAAEFAPHDLTTNTSHSPFVVSASSSYGTYLPWHAFEGSYLHASAPWICNATTGWIKLDIGLGNSKILTAYDVCFNDATYADRAPKNWTMQGSNDNSTWDTLDTVTNQTAWGDAEKRSFICDVQTTAYRYFQLVISANNGNASYVMVGELYLQGNDPAPPDVELAGTSAGTSTTAGAIQVTRSLAGVSAGTSTVAGALRTGVKLDGASAGDSTAAGALQVARYLAGVSAGNSTVTAALLVERFLAGQSQGITLVTGALLIPIRRRIFSDGGAAGAVHLFGSPPSGSSRIFSDAPTAGTRRIFKR